MMKGLILWAIALAIEFYKILKLRKTRKFYQQMVNTLKRLDVVKVKQLKKKFLDGAYKWGQYVLCQGTISADQPIKSSLGVPKKSVVYSNLMVDKVFEIGQSRNTVRKRIRQLFTGFLKLSEQDQHIKIFQTMNTQILPHKIMKKTISSRQKIFNFSWLLRLIIKSPSRSISNIYFEEYIPDNSDVTILAKIPKDVKQIQFKQPIAMAGSKERLIVFYKDIVEYNTYLSYGMYFILGITVFMFYKFYVKPKFLQFLASRKKSQISKIDRIYVTDLNCSICHAVLSNIINNPCGHLNICNDCNVIKNAKLNTDCLECHKTPKDVILVYPC